jgi:polysaccharide chain length determinant protein (PEP-CTERM system associated)
MTQDVLARTQLLGIIEELGLYPRERRRLAPEELVDLMRRDVSLVPIQSDPQRKNDLDALKISFRADSPQLAQGVTSKLTALFIQQNLKTREDLATTTTKFLREQLDSARTKLADQEQRLRDFKMQYLGELPEQQQGNLGILGSLQSQLQNVSSSLNRAQQQKLYLESLLAQYQRIAQRPQGPTSSSSPSAPLTVSPIETAQRDLARLQSEREQLLTSYTLKHPEVLRKDQQIAQKQSLIEELKTGTIAKTEEPKPKGGTPEPSHQVTRETQQDEAVVAQLKSQLEANRLEIDNLSKSDQQLKTEISQYEARLNLTPVREQQLTAILRDYELLKQQYAELVNKEQQSQLAATLEKHQEGQQFRMVDPPSLPVVPSSPKRLRMSLGGFVAGIFLGLALAFLIDKSNSSFHEEKPVSQRFTLPLVIGIPVLATRSEQRIRAFRRTLEWLCGSAILLVVFAAEFYVFRHG